MKKSKDQRNCPPVAVPTNIRCKQNTTACVMSGSSACARVRAHRRADSSEPERTNHATPSPLAVLCNTHFLMYSTGQSACPCHSKRKCPHLHAGLGDAMSARRPGNRCGKCSVCLCSRSLLDRHLIHATRSRICCTGARHARHSHFQVPPLDHILLGSRLGNEISGGNSRLLVRPALIPDSCQQPPSTPLTTICRDKRQSGAFHGGRSHAPASQLGVGGTPGGPHAHQLMAAAVVTAPQQVHIPGADEGIKSNTPSCPGQLTMHTTIQGAR